MQWAEAAIAVRNPLAQGVLLPVTAIGAWVGQQADPADPALTVELNPAQVAVPAGVPAYRAQAAWWRIPPRAQTTLTAVFAVPQGPIAGRILIGGQVVPPS